MPEENAEDQAIAKLGGAAPKMFSSRGLLVVGVGLAVWTVALVVLLRLPRGAVRTTDRTGVAARAIDPRWLDVDAVPIDAIRVPVRVDPDGLRERIVIVQATIRLGPRYEGESPDVKGLNKAYVPRARSLAPEFAEYVFKELSAKDYAQTQNKDVLNQMRQGMVGEFNNILQRHGLEPRVAGVTMTLSLEQGY